MFVRFVWLSVILSSLLVGLIIKQVDGSDKKRMEFVYNNLMDSSGIPAKEPIFSIDFVAKELTKWRWLESSQKHKLLNMEASQTMDHLVDLNKLNVKCEHDDLMDRLTMEQKYDRRYINLHPFIKYTNLILTNACYQDYQFKLLQLLEADFDRIKWVAWYFASKDDEKMLQSYEIKTLRSKSLRTKMNPNLASLTDEDRLLKNFSARLGLYLKHFYHKIESQYHATKEEHLAKIKLEVELILETVCPRLQTPSLSSDEASARQTHATYSHSSGQLDTEYYKLMQNLAKKLDDDERFLPFTQGMYKYKYICENINYKRQLIDKVQRYFVNILDELEHEDRIIENFNQVAASDYFAMRQLLFAKNKLPNLRMGDQFNLISALYIGMRNGMLPNELMSDTQILSRLIELREISVQKCTLEALSERVELEKEFNEQFIVLNPYVGSLNVLQFDICNQKLRQLASNALTIDPIQLTQLEKLRSLIEKRGSHRQLTYSLHEVIEPDSFARGAADFLYLSSPSKISKKSLVNKLQELMEETCRDLTRSKNLEYPMQMYTYLYQLNLTGPLNDATKRALSYGRICKYFTDREYQIASILQQFQSSPLRHPKHLTSSSWLSCLKPEVIE